MPFDTAGPIVCIGQTVIARLTTDFKGTKHLNIQPRTPQGPTIDATTLRLRLLDECPDFCLITGITLSSHPIETEDEFNMHTANEKELTGGKVLCDTTLVRSNHHQRELETLQHALGLNEFGEGRMFRNHFVAGKGSTDFLMCTSLVDLGLMVSRGASELTGGDTCFTVTANGIAYMKLHSPVKPKRTRSQQNYLDYLDADCGYTFKEWLTTTRTRKAF